MVNLSLPNLKKYKIAFNLAIATVIIALAEALFSTYFGYKDESLTLFGFGIGSLIEVISAIGVAHMIIRIRNNSKSNRDTFERTALKITGYGFYILVAGLIITSLYNFWTGHKPETTFSGIIISVASIILMYILLINKTRIGKKLNSDAILADGECTKVCIYMSIVLLLASGIYYYTKFLYIDNIGTLFLCYFSFKEGKECFEKAVSNKHCVSC